MIKFLLISSYCINVKLRRNFVQSKDTKYVNYYLQMLEYLKDMFTLRRSEYAVYVTLL